MGATVSKMTLPLSILRPVGTKLIAQKAAQFGAVAAIGSISQLRTFPDGVSTLQEFPGSAIFYHPAYGAISINRAIYNKWNSITASKTADGHNLRDYLGFPISDTFTTVESGGTAAYFERGMIVVRGNGVAYVLSGPIYEHYRRLGNIGDPAARPVVGLPISDEEAVANNGRCTHFDGGDIYWSAATDAREIHGAIRDRWLALGGAGSVLGLPTSDECGVQGANPQGGRFNRFANGGFIYWTPATGAWDVYGAIYNEWSSRGGPLGPLGFPVSGETDTPALPALPGLGNLPKGRFNDFQRGVIVWYPSGDYVGAHTVQGVQLHAIRYECNDDFNVQINIAATPANPPNVNHGRMPSGGNYNGGGVDVSSSYLLTVPVVQGNTQVSIWMLCIHENTIGADDEEGTVTANYNILNLWGLMENSHAHQNGAFTATFAMQPFPSLPVSLDPAQFRSQFFWPFQNVDIDQLSWRTYSDTFADVAETDKHIDLNPFSFKMHLFEITFYQLVYQSLAQPGTCFGFCLESIYARENRSLFIEPIFTQNSYHKDGILRDSNGGDLITVTEQTVPSQQDAEVVNEASIKHGYQMGASLISWFLGAWLTGNLHQPIDAFYSSRSSFAANDWPIISVSSGSDLSQSAHVLVPYQWSPPQGGDLTISVANINDPASGSTDAANTDPTNYVTINPTDDSYSFDMHPDKGVAGVWFGSPTTGGRFVPIPYSKLNSQPVTPGDAIFALILGGVLIICAGDAQATQITDEHRRIFFTKPAQVKAVAATAAHLQSGLSVKPVAEAVSAHVPVRSEMNPIQPKRINLDAATRIPGMVLVPLHHSTQPHSAQDAQVRSGGQAVHDAVRAATKSPEVYYLERSGIVSMEAKSPLVSEQIAVTSIVADRFTTRVPLPEQLVQQTSLTFSVEPRTDGSYDWAILTPRMSVSISAPCSTGVADTIRIDSVNASDQAVTLGLAANAAAKTINMAVGGFSGGDSTDRKWYELLNLNLAPGQTISAQVNNKGGELLLQNTGPATTFELRIHYGMDPARVAVRSSVSLDANLISHIAPQEWSAAAIVKTPVQMTVFDAATGAQIRQSQL